MTLIDAVRATLRRLHYSIRTEEAYIHWIRALIRLHGKRHPRTMRPIEITAFPNDLATGNRAQTTKLSSVNSTFPNRRPHASLIHSNAPTLL